MKRKITIAAAVLTVFLCGACDDGRIYETVTATSQEGRVAKLTGTLTGLDSWASGYNVVLAGFSEESEFAVITKSLTTTADGQVETVLSGISDEVSTVELCVVNRLRKRLLTFQSLTPGHATDTIRIEAGTLNVGMYATLQDKLFSTTCANCHGASTSAAAGLYLTKGKSHAALVGQPSSLYTNALLVSPGDAENSLLYQALSTDISSTWRYDHSKEVLSESMLKMLGDWIDHGAKE